MNALANYDAACHALQQAASVDEVLNIRDQAEAMRAYGRQARNKELETYAQEIRLRAERKLGALITAQKETHGLNKGSQRQPLAVVADDRQEKVPTLAEMGISKDLSSRAQKLAAVPDAEFEANIVEHKRRVAAENARVVNKLEAAGAKAMGGKKPAKSLPDDALAAENARLTTEMAELADFIAELQQMLKDTQSENETFVRVVEADEQLAAAIEEVKRHKAVAVNAERTLAAKSGEFVERAKAVTYWKNRAEKAEKALARLEKAA